MNQGIKTVIYPVRDIAGAKTLYSKLLGTEPYADTAYYVGFRVNDQEIGLDPNGKKQGMTWPVGYYHVDDIKKSLQLLLDAGAQVVQDVKDVDGESSLQRSKTKMAISSVLFNYLNCYNLLLGFLCYPNYHYHYKHLLNKNSHFKS